MPITLKLLALCGVGVKHLRSWNVCQNRLFHSLEIKVFAAIVTGYRLECFLWISVLLLELIKLTNNTLWLLLSILRIISIPFERSVITISADFVFSLPTTVSSSQCPKIPLFSASSGRSSILFPFWVYAVLTWWYGLFITNFLYRQIIVCQFDKSPSSM